MVNENNKYVPKAPKTYEVRYVEYKEPSKIVQFANYVGISTTRCYEDGPHEVQAQPPVPSNNHDPEQPSCIIL